MSLLSCMCLVEKKNDFVFGIFLVNLFVFLQLIFTETSSCLEVIMPIKYAMVLLSSLFVIV